MIRYGFEDIDWRSDEEIERAEIEEFEKTREALSAPFGFFAHANPTYRSERENVTDGEDFESFAKAIAVTPNTPSRFAFSKNKSAAPEKQKPTLVYKRHRDADGFLWSQGFDEAGELQSMMIIWDEEE